MTEPKRIEYDHASKQDKHFFGGYFNLAWNNIDLILKSFAEEFKVKKANQFSESLRNFFRPKEKEITQLDFEYRADYINRYFPIVGILKHLSYNKNKSAYIEAFVVDLGLILNTIENLRNFYTHYYHAPFDIKEERNRRLCPLLNTLLLAIIEMVNKNKKGDDKTQELIKDSLHKELEILREEKEEWMIGNKYNPTTESINNAVFNDAFNHMRYKPKKKSEFELSRHYQSQWNYKDDPENGMWLSQSAIVFLLSAFLSKKEGEEFRGRIKGFKAKVICNPEQEVSRENNSLRFMATHWVYSWAAFKGYKRKLNTDYLKETLLVQIMDELSKVPDSVYEVLSHEKRKEFLEDINEFVQEFDEAKSLSEATVIHPVIRKRYENKFNYFVIRYLDEFVEFPSLKFQVHLGNYIHDRRDKAVPGVVGETRRVIKEKINVFGKLSELSKLKVENLRAEESTNNGWELFPNPSYNFVGNNVPIYLSLPKYHSDKIEKYREEVSSLEERKERKGKLDKISIIKQVINVIKEDQIGKSETQVLVVEEPVAMLSLNELPALLYEYLVNKRNPKQIEKTLMDKLKGKIDKIEKLTLENVNEASCIPKTLQKAKKTEQINKKKLQTAIKEEIEQTKERQKQLNDTKTPQGEYRLKKKAKGEMATWMAKDLIRLMPMPYRAKWKGYHHRQLQASLAFYHNKERRDAVDLLCSVWDFPKDKDFYYSQSLKSAFDRAFSFENLLLFYFNLRVEMLEAMNNSASITKSKLFNKGVKQQRIWTFFNKRLYSIDAFDNLKAKILAKPLVFDRGIFDDKPTFIKDVQYKDSPERFADWYRYTQDYTDYQAFYRYDREYSELYELEKEKKNGELTDKEKFIIHLKRDRKIKQNKVEDLFLKLIAEDLGKQVFNVSAEESVISLSDIFTTQAERINQQADAMGQSKRKKGDYSDNKVKESYIWSKTFAYEQGQIYEPEVKLKDFGKFRQLLEDARVIKLFSYNPSKIWNKKEIEEELQRYELIRREYVFKEIQDFEAYLWKREKTKKHPSDFENNGGIPNFKKYIEKGVLEKTKIEEKSSIESSAQFLILLRNKFAHNQLIELEDWNLLQKTQKPYDQETFESIADYLYYTVKSIISEMKEELEGIHK